MALDKKAETLKISIAKLTALIAVQAKKAAGEELISLGIAIGILNQASLVAEVSTNEASKLLTLARSMKSGRGKKDERKKRSTKARTVSRVNESRKKNTTR